MTPPKTTAFTEEEQACHSRCCCHGSSSNRLALNHELPNVLLCVTCRRARTHDAGLLVFPHLLHHGRKSLSGCPAHLNITFYFLKKPFFPFFFFFAQRSFYEVALMEPAPRSCPHCLGQDEKRLLFRKAALSSPSNHASSHACSPSSVSEGGRGGEAGHFLGLGSPQGRDIMCFSESWGVYKELLTLVFRLVAQNRVALWGNGNAGVTVSSCESGTNA